ncbi:MAG: ComEC/Rec2 family competence protein, partial [Burkholderiales bacterium]
MTPVRDPHLTSHASRFPLHVLLFVSGAWLLQQQPELPSLLWCYLFAACVLVRWLARDGLVRFRWVVDPVLCIAAGFLWASVVAQAKLADRLPAQWEGQDVRVEGTVAGMPVAFERGVRFRFDVERVLTPLAQIPSSIQLAWYAEAQTPPPELHAGERWRLSVRLKRPHGAANPHGFDFEFWMLERGIRASGYVRPKAAHERIDSWNARYLVEILRERIRDRIERAFPNAGSEGISQGVLVALAVGEQRAISAEQWRLFTRTGVNHLMSISGLHITMLSGLAALGMGWCWRRSSYLVLRFPAQKAALIAGLAIAVLYAAIAGFAVPAQRTVLMLAAIVLALLWSRTWSSSFVLAASLFVVTLFDPFAVMAPGFWLSFGAVALITYASVHRTGIPS